MFAGFILLSLPIFGLLIIVLLAVKFIGSAGFKGWLGEKMVIEIGLKRLDPALYQHYHDLYLPRPDGKGTTQIDHVVVSPYGIFVIETKNYKGWIFGSEKQRQWTQQIYRSKHRFQNPLHQNHLHMKALMLLLDLPEASFRPVVFFIGGAVLKTPMPGKVLTHGLLHWIKNHTLPVLDPATVQRANQRLGNLSVSTNRQEAARNHARALRERNVA